MGRRILLSLPSVVLFVAACSSGTTKVVTADQASADLASSICNKVDSCAHINIQVAFGDVATCTSRYKTKFSSLLVARGTGANVDNVEACARGYGEATCAELIAGITPAGCDVQWLVDGWRAVRRRRSVFRRERLLQHRL